MEEKLLDKAKRSGKAYLKIEDDTSATVTGLPSPSELTNDTDWKENGRLRKIYHLGLTAKNIDDGDDPVQGWEIDVSEIINGNNGDGTNVTRTPYACRNGCKYYDGIKDVNDSQFKEYCDITGKGINEGYICPRFETKGVKLPEGVLTF